MAQLICSLPRLKHKTLHPFQPSQVSFQTHLTQTIIMEHSSIANPTDYKLWSGTDTIEWIISIDSSKFEKYREELAQSFKDHNFTGANISELDREDLKDYGIIDLEDRRAIYKAFIQLIATQKKRDSQSQSLTNLTTTSIINHQTESQDHEIKTSHSLSISDDEDNELDREYSQDTQSSFSETEDETYVDIDHIHILQQQERLITEGFCEWIPDDIYQAYIEKLTSNWIRKHYHLQYPTNPLLPHDLSGLITQFHGITFDSVVNDQCVSIESGDMKYSTTVTNIQLSKILKSKAESNSNLSIKPEDVQTSILEHILVYLGVEPEALQWSDGDSMNIKEIVSDEWDAEWINGFDDVTLSLIRKAARHLKIQCLGMPQSDDIHFKHETNINTHTVYLANIPMITNLYSFLRE